MTDAIRRRLRRLARDGAIALAVALGILVALELGLRAFFPQVLSGTSVRGEHFSVIDRQVGLQYVPGAVWRFRHPEYTVEYAINDRGLRDATRRPAKKPAGTFRILLLGDSFTFGQGVEYAESWPVAAERALARQGLGRVDLVKAGRQGMDTRSELLLLRELAAEYEPDAVVVGFLINDLYTNLPIEAGSDEVWNRSRSQLFQLKGSALKLHLPTFVRRLAVRTDESYVRLYLLTPRRGDFLQRPLPEKAETQLEITKKLLRQFAATCGELGVPLYVLSIPQQFQVLYRPEASSRIEVDLYDRELGRLAQASGFTWIPTLEDFRRVPPATPLFHRLDGHLTAAGNAVVAEAFVREVVPRALAARLTPVAGADKE